MANPRLIPNTCQVPNVILDTVMRKVSHPEFKVLMAIVRKTYGWNKDRDRISISQLVEITGVSKAQVLRALESLSWIVEAHKGKYRNEYSINIDSATGLLKGGDQDGLTVIPVSPRDQDGLTVIPNLVSPGDIQNPLKPTTKPTTLQKHPNPQVKEFIQWWCQRYKELLRDDYMVRWALEGSIVKKLLESKSLEEVKRRAERLLTTTDRWLRQHRTIPMLLSKWNDLGQLSSSEPEEQEGPSLRIL